MTFAWSKTVEEKARAFCKALTGSEDDWEDYISDAVNAELVDARSKPKSKGSNGYYKICDIPPGPWNMVKQK